MIYENNKKFIELNICIKFYYMIVNFKINLKVNFEELHKFMVHLMLIK